MTFVERSRNSPKFLLNSAISVGQTKVKSFGHQNITVHRPSLLIRSSEEMSKNSLPFSTDTTAVFLNAGNACPIDKIPFVIRLLIVLNFCERKHKRNPVISHIEICYDIIGIIYNWVSVFMQTNEPAQFGYDSDPEVFAVRFCQFLINLTSQVICAFFWRS